MNHLENVDARGQTVLTKCRVKENDACGKGLHIFIPRKREGILAGTRNRLLSLITNTPITVHSPKRCEEWNKLCVNKKNSSGWLQSDLSPQVGGLDQFGYIYKIISYFAHEASVWKDSFFQTEYIVEELLRKDGSHKKSDVTLILNQISDAHLIKQGHKLKRRQ